MTRRDAAQLTERQQAILDWIRAFILEHQMPPTVREISRVFRMSSAGMFGHLKALQRKGWLIRGELGARSLRLREPASPGHEWAVRVPVVGLIAAGMPLFAVQNIDGFISVDQGMLQSSGGKFFALRVKGDSMIEAGILEGDHVIVLQQATADDGEIVVALLEDEATLKRFYREKDRIRLEPANSSMKPIYADEVRVQGVVRGVIRGLGAQR